MPRNIELDNNSLPDILATGEKRKLTLLRKDLIDWFFHNGRKLPWRDSGASIYQKIAVEVLLQRTTATAVARFHETFFNRFQSWDSLAAATPESLEEFLRPLGLWRRRAKSLLGLANYAVSIDGQFPRDRREHVNIPAVGQYVSNAIALFQHGDNAPLLDVNMARVIERFVRPRRLSDIRYDPWLQAAANWYVRGRNAEFANWAILDFASLICKPRRPLCEGCPLEKRCHKNGVGN